MSPRGSRGAQRHQVAGLDGGGRAQLAAAACRGGGVARRRGVVLGGVGVAHLEGPLGGDFGGRLEVRRVPYQMYDVRRTIIGKCLPRALTRTTSPARSVRTSRSRASCTR